MNKLEVTFKVKLKADEVCDKESLKKDFDGSWLKCLKWLYKNEGMFFSEELKLTDVIELQHRKERTK